MKEKVINVGLAGFGAAAKVMHAPFLKVSAQYNVISVLERNRNESAELFPSAKIVRSFEKLLSIDEIDLIIITTPNETHYSYAKEALLKGKNVLLEKPFTITSVEALDLIEIAKSKNLILTIYQNRRYTADFITVKEILQKKLLGEVHEYEAHYDRYRPQLKPKAWREDSGAGNGIFYDLGSHLIDQAFCLFGIPKTVTADIRLQRTNAKADDYFDLRMDYGFLRVILKGSMLVREPGPRFMIHGTKGSFIKYGEDPQEVLLKQGILPVAGAWGNESEENFGLLHTEIDKHETKIRYASLHGSFGLLYADLYETLCNDAELKIKPEHGYNSIRLIELANKSSEIKATVECTDFINVEYP